MIIFALLSAYTAKNQINVFKINYDETTKGIDCNSILKSQIQPKCAKPNCIYVFNIFSGSLNTHVLQ